MSWKPAILAAGESSFCTNGLVFATEEEALDSAGDLASRWILVKDFTALESDEPVNYKRVDGKDVHL